MLHTDMDAHTAAIADFANMALMMSRDYTDSSRMS